MDTPELWRWLWLVTSAAFVLGEMASAGTFFLLPFAVGAAVATVLAFLGVAVVWEWAAFVGASAAAFAVLWPLGRRLDRREPSEGIGALRLEGEIGRVTEAIPGAPNELGTVRIGREEWRAESLDGSPIPEGAYVRVAGVRGTRLLVHPTELVTPNDPAGDRSGS